MLRADRAGAEGDGGNVPFARGPQAQDETERALGQPGLVGVGHDGRIEQRGGLRRVFVREVSADERLPFGRRLPGLAQVTAHLREAVAEKLFNVLVPVRKLAQHLAQQLGDFLIRERHDAGDNPSRNVVGGGIKRAHQHPRTVRGQGWPDAFGMEGGRVWVWS